MALADEVYQSQHYKEKEKKKKKSFSEAFIPHKGDSGKEIASKIFSLFAIVVLIACIAVRPAIPFGAARLRALVFSCFARCGSSAVCFDLFLMMLPLSPFIKAL